MRIRAMFPVSGPVRCVCRHAFYGLPDSSRKHWAAEREYAFRQLVAEEKYRGVVYQGLETAP
ncbi:hypothetical protein MJI20_28255, partial [Salmonella enterica subsp. enterica serovar Anatum]|nr:hypothetical protein [Salmonella enterica subsp. enterica serovar Anatum]